MEIGIGKEANKRQIGKEYENRNRKETKIGMGKEGKEGQKGNEA